MVSDLGSIPYPNRHGLEVGDSEVGERMKAQSLTLLSAPLVTFAIILANLFVFIAYLHDPQVVFPLLNTWGNFPWGLLTSIFTPDTQVLLGKTMFSDWFIITGGSLVAYLALFLVVNIGRDDHDLASRSVLFAILLIVVSVASNFFSLMYSPGSVGPSTAIYSALGIDVGLGIGNAALWFEAGRPGLGPLLAFGTGMGIIVGPTIVILSLVAPQSFFLIEGGVDWQAHVFCYVLSAVVAVAWAFMRSRTIHIGSAYPSG
jgi:hypothetical protein